MGVFPSRTRGKRILHYFGKGKIRERNGRCRLAAGMPGHEHCRRSLDHRGDCQRPASEKNGDDGRLKIAWPARGAGDKNSGARNCNEQCPGSDVCCGVHLGRIVKCVCAPAQGRTGASMKHCRLSGVYHLD
jgi:hypothetical protein